MKKTWIYVGCVAVIIVALAAMIIFAFSGKDEDYDYPNNKEKVELTGTWEVVALVESGQTTLLDNQFMVFEGEKASQYKDNTTEPAATSAYSVTDDNILKLSDIGREYVIDKKTDDYISLYETQDKHMVLFRYPNEDMSAIEIDKEMFVGKWNVAQRSADIQSEVLEVTADAISDYRNGSEKPVLESPYSWTERGNISAEKLGKEFEFHPVSETSVFLIECDTGYVWILSKAE